jgi:hypothetical protein
VLCSVLHCTDPTLRFCTVLYSVVQCSAVKWVVLGKALASPHVTSEFPLSLQTAAVILHLTVTYMLLLLNIHNKLLYYTVLYYYYVLLQWFVYKSTKKMVSVLHIMIHAYIDASVLVTNNF